MKKGLLKDGFKLKISDGKGEGVFSTRSFKVDEIVMIGEIEKVLEKNHSHASQIGENDYVFHAGLISKVNHSCNPNCGISVNETGAHDFVAIRDITVNEEITFDYAMRNYGINYFPEECLCGSERCRGKITGWKDLTNEKKKEYKDFAAPYLLALDIKRSCVKV